MLTTDHETYLVVDDDEGMRTLLKTLLEVRKKAVSIASNSDEAIEILSHNKGSISAAIIDLNLGGKRGEELFDELTLIKDDLPIFLISGCGSDEMHDRIGHRRIAGMISKPFHSMSFVDTLTAGVEKFSSATLSSQSV